MKKSILFTSTRFFFASVCLLVTVYTVQAHTDDLWLVQYQKAQQHYQAARYTAAKETLLPLVNHPHYLKSYALFYYALSAYHSEEKELAEATLASIVDQQCDWEKINEVYYWLGQLKMECKIYMEGMTWLERIDDASYTLPVERLKKYFLGAIEESTLLEMLFRAYPKDRSVALSLFHAIMKQPIVERDRELLDQLVQQFDFVVQEDRYRERLRSKKKSIYNVAVLLPFFVGEIDYQEESSNPLVVSLYQGIKTAVEELNQRNIPIRLFAYDTKKDPVVTSELLKDKALASMDLLIGPLSAATVPIVSVFAQEHQINVFNPLSENAAVVGHNLFAFLFQASTETQARRAADFMVHQTDKVAKVAVFYSEGKQEEVVKARAFQRRIACSCGEDTVTMVPMGVEESQQFLAMLRARDKGEEQDIWELSPIPQDLSHVYIASKDELIVSNVLSAMEMLSIQPIIMGDASWLQQGYLTVDWLQQLRLYLVAPQYIDYANSVVADYRKKFYINFAQHPTYHAYVGYAMMIFLGKMLSQYGSYFQKEWAYYTGHIFSDRFYGYHHDNQCVPIIRFVGDRFVLCEGRKNE